MKHIPALLLFLIGSAAAYAAPPGYTVMRTSGAIVIDGVLDEADWAKAAPVGDFVFPWWTAGDKEQTEVKILWDDDYLYLAFKCSDKHIWAEIYDTNAKTYLDDSVELFWDPSGGVLSSYNQCEVNCIGNMLSVSNPSRETIMVPRIGRTIDGSVNNDSDTDTGWAIEMLLRFDEYSGAWHGEAPKAGDAWKIGLNRSGGKTNQQYSQWSPSRTAKPSFHQPDDFGTIIFSSLPAGTVSVEKSKDGVPGVIRIGASPNPFNPSTTISYSLAAPGEASLAVYDLTGRKVTELAGGRHSAGTHTVLWNGLDADGASVASGVYLARIESAGMTATQRMTLLK